jgi:hypothetical protein
MSYNIMLIKGIINTLVRLIPLSLYMGSIMSSFIFDNKRAVVILFGFLFVEIMSFGYNSFNKSISSANCALVRSESQNLALPAPIPLSVGFFVSFIITDMMDTNNFKPIKFYLLIMLLFITIWSRINVGCHNIIESIIAGLIGVTLGMAYYKLVKDKYQEDDSKSSDNVSIEESKIYQLLNM